MKFFSTLILLILSLSTYSYEYPNLDLSSPQKTMNYFLKTMKGHKLGNTRGLSLATKTLNLESLDSKTQEIKGREYAIKLSNTFDKIEYIDVKKIPSKPKHNIWFYRAENLELDGKKEKVEISIAKTSNGNWLFTKETLLSLKSYDKYLKSRKVVKNVAINNTFKEKLRRELPEWAFKENFLLLNVQWLALFFIILVSYIVDRIVRLYIAVRLVGLLGRKGVKFTEKEQKKFTTPIGFLAFTLTLNWAVKGLELPDKILSYFLKGCEIAITVSIILVVVKLIDIVCLFLEKKAKETENKFDDILVPLIRKTSRFFVYSFGVIFIGDALDINMKNILAGMGIGGIAFALAAKDTVSNLFGSFTVLVDRPFSIGDWVVINSKVEGTVVEVGLRSTRIKTFYDSIITVPNGTLTNAHIDNLGQRTYRRYSTKLTIDYSTPVEKIENFCEAIRQLILKHPNTRKDYFHVYFNDMAASSLEILLYVFWKVPDWSCELNERHNLLLDIMRVAKEMEVSFAFPTQTLHLMKDEQLAYTPEERDFQKVQGMIKEIDMNRKIENGHRSDKNNCN
ncbi:MAG: hypothetical protein BM556_15000 [Bacteriovorax sp. MedPE-SWde]|nr:MAG: hypothetical protein BM556_15000 [Bacteriovorax sp. MedPE-SWde]